MQTGEDKWTEDEPAYKDLIQQKCNDYRLK